MSEDGLEERINDLVDALMQISQWCEAYPEDVFTPMDADKKARAHAALVAADIEPAVLYASWARHLLGGIGKIARDALRP